MAVRRVTRAVASLSSDSPSRMVVTRDEMPTPRAIEVATASVGERMAPKAIHQGSSRLGMIQWKKKPKITEERITRETARPPMALNSRRKFMAGMFTAEEKSSGGSTTARMISGSTSTSGTNGKKLTRMPMKTRISGAAMFQRGPRRELTAMTTTAAMTTKMAMSMSRTPFCQARAHPWVRIVWRSFSTQPARIAPVHEAPRRSRVVGRLVPGRDPGPDPCSSGGGAPQEQTVQTVKIFPSTPSRPGRQTIIWKVCLRRTLPPSARTLPRTPRPFVA